MIGIICDVSSLSPPREYFALLSIQRNTSTPHAAVMVSLPRRMRKSEIGNGQKSLKRSWPISWMNWSASMAPAVVVAAVV